ncbi:MAG: diguanylate cyclase, partial [Cryptosporangiaceae bacterium]|nr:diguanylate cyclase [Cryptosporangiaceae bacterium]
MRAELTPVPVAARGAHGPRARRRRSVTVTVALAGVLLALAAFTLQGNLRTSRATTAQSHAMDLDMLFVEVRHAVLLEELSREQHVTNPSDAVRGRFTSEAAIVTSTLVRADDTGGDGVAGDVAGLLRRQHAYRIAADTAMADPQADPSPVRAAFDALSADADRVTSHYQSAAAGQAGNLEDAQRRMVAGTGAGFALGLCLLAVIWRLVLGYQRRLAEHADASQHLALHDALTGLPNRTLFDLELRSALDAARHTPDRLVALLIVDLNEFKSVNDTLGHPAGDELLASVAQRLRDTAREFDVVARFGGDEFAVLLPDVPSRAAAEALAKRIAFALREDFRLAAGPAAVSGSIGLAIGPARDPLAEPAADGADAEELVRHADAAMYRAKASGRAVVVFEQDPGGEAPSRLGLFGELRSLLTTGDPDEQLVLHFQPQVRIADATVTAVEALVRWQHPERGLLQPDQFLAAAETGGLEIPLTYHLLEAGVAHASRWKAAGRPLVVSINVSPRCLLDDEFVPRVLAAVQLAGLPPSLLKLELTEHTLMAEPDRAVSVLRA